jgi:hypothetical protein
VNANGVPSFSPRSRAPNAVRPARYLGSPSQKMKQPQRGCIHRRARGGFNPFRVDARGGRGSQGRRSCVAPTPGWMIQRLRRCNCLKGPRHTGQRVEMHQLGVMAKFKLLCESKDNSPGEIKYRRGRGIRGDRLGCCRTRKKCARLDAPPRKAWDWRTNRPEAEWSVGPAQRKMRWLRQLAR